jgi:septum formation protein
MKLVLGSQSEGRQHVLQAAGYKYTILPAHIDEKAIRTTDLNKLPLLVARAKALALLPKLSRTDILITADSIAVWDGQLREKPESLIEARKFLESYSQSSVRNITGVVVTNLENGAQYEGVESATAWFSHIPAQAVDALLAEGRIMNYAGGYGIENPLLSPYVVKVDGEVSCVTGLPLTLTKRLLKLAGYPEP